MVVCAVACGELQLIVQICTCTVLVGRLNMVSAQNAEGGGVGGGECRLLQLLVTSVLHSCVHNPLTPSAQPSHATWISYGR